MAFVILRLLWQTVQSLTVQYFSFRQVEQKLPLWVQVGIIKAMVFSLGKTWSVVNTQPQKELGNLATSKIYASFFVCMQAYFADNNGFEG